MGHLQWDAKFSRAGKISGFRPISRYDDSDKKQYMQTVMTGH